MRGLRQALAHAVVELGEGREVVRRLEGEAVFRLAVGGGAAFLFATDGEVEMHLRLGREGDAELRVPGIELVGRRLEADVRAAHRAIEAAIAEHQLVASALRRQVGATPVAIEAAHFEDVLVVAGELQVELRLDLFEAEVDDAHVLVASVVPQQLGAEHMHRAFRNRIAPVRMQVGIHQFDHEQAVVVLHRGIEEHRPHAAELQFEVGEEAGVVVIQPFLAEADRLDIAEAVEQREGFVVLEHAAPLVGRRCRRQNVPLLAEPDLLDHDCAPVRKSERDQTAPCRTAAGSRMPWRTR